MARFQIVQEDIDAAFESLKLTLKDRLNEKGAHSFTSLHEILGVVAEEYTELLSAVQSNDHDLALSELDDIAIACLWSRISIMKGQMDW